MAVITKITTPSLATSVPCHSNLVDQGGDKKAGEAIAAGDICYKKASDGLIYRAIGTAANEAAIAWGIAARAAAIGQPITIYKDVEFEYAAGMTIGAALFVSLTAGSLADAATTGGTTIVARAVSATRIRFKGDL